MWNVIVNQLIRRVVRYNPHPQSVLHLGFMECFAFARYLAVSLTDTFLFLKDYSQRQPIFPLLAHSCDSEWDHAGVWRKHSQRHLHEPRSQVLFFGFHGL